MPTQVPYKKQKRKIQAHKKRRQCEDRAERDLKTLAFKIGAMQPQAEC